MLEIRILNRDDLQYIFHNIVKELNVSSIVLERGYLASNDEGKSMCVFLIRDEEGKRYKIEAQTKYFRHNGDVSLYPYEIWKSGEYRENFAFNEAEVAKALELLGMGLKGKIIDWSRFTELAKLVTTSKKEFVQEVSQYYNPPKSGLVGLALGVVAGLISYDYAHIAGYYAREYSDYWQFVVASGWLGASIGIPISAFNFSKKLKLKKSDEHNKLTQAIQTIESRLKH